MASLADLLVDTQLFQASIQGGTPISSGLEPAVLSVSEPRDANGYPDAMPPGPFHSSWTVIPALAAHNASSARIAINPIWSWTHDLADLAVLRDVKVYARDVKKDLTVCEEIECADVGVTLTDGTSIELPLSREFLLERHHLASGRMILQGHDLWPLECETDHSLLLVLGYSLEADGPVPIDLAATTDPAFFPDQPFSTGWGTPPAGAAIEVAYGETATVEARGPRVIVALSFVCNKERADWEPLGVLGAGRIYPTIMVAADTPLNEVRGRIRYKRPQHSSHCCDAEMPSELGTILVADCNETVLEDTLNMCSEAAAEIKTRTGVDISKPFSTLLGYDLPEPPPPMWTFVFDYYDLMPFDTQWDTPESPFAVNDAAAFSRPRSKSTSTHFVGIYPHEPGDPAPPVLKNAIERNFRGDWPDGWYYPGEVRKAIGQGAFDNIHVAPSMSAESLVNQLAWNSTVLTKQEYIDRTFVKKITMAPVCMHDCFHLHWRWGSGQALDANPGNHWLLGWDDSWDPSQPWSPGKPFQTPGAPLMPRNQLLVVDLHTKREFSLTTTASPFEVEGEKHPIPARAWTIFNHTGCSIGIGLSMFHQYSTTGATEAIWQGALPRIELSTGKVTEGPIPNPSTGHEVDWDPFFRMEVNPAVPYAAGHGNMGGGTFTHKAHWSLFYWHLRFGGKDGHNFDVGYNESPKDDDVICERIKIVDFDKCKSHGIPAHYL